MVEIAFDGVQASTRYPGGVTLRFARVLRYRPDKSAAEADTIDAVRALWSGDDPETGRAWLTRQQRQRPAVRRGQGPGHYGCDAGRLPDRTAGMAEGTLPGANAVAR